MLRYDKVVPIDISPVRDLLDYQNDSVGWPRHLPSLVCVTEGLILQMPTMVCSPIACVSTEECA
jgi:hypothetical protein